MIKSTYIFHFGNPDIWKNSTCWFYCQIVCYLRKKLSKDMGSLGSHQLLQLQLFPNFFKILDPPFNFILPVFIWFIELRFSFATNLDFLEFYLRSIVSFILEVGWSKYTFVKPMLLIMEFVYFKSLTFALSMFLFDHYQRSVQVWIGALVLYAVAISEVKRTSFIAAQSRVFWTLNALFF